MDGHCRAGRLRLQKILLSRLEFIFICHSVLPYYVNPLFRCSSYMSVWLCPYFSSFVGKLVCPSYCMFSVCLYVRLYVCLCEMSHLIGTVDDHFGEDGEVFLHLRKTISGRQLLMTLLGLDVVRTILNNSTTQVMQKATPSGQKSYERGFTGRAL